MHASPSSTLLSLFAAVAMGGGCTSGGPGLDPPGLGEGEEEGAAEGEGEGEGEGEPVPATNDTCLDATPLAEGEVFTMGLFTATASRHSCSATNAAGDDGIDDVAFSFVLTQTSDVVITADGNFETGETYASPTLTLFENALCTFPQPKRIDERTCVGDGLSFDEPTVMRVEGLPAGTWFVVAETFGDLSPFRIQWDRE